MRGEIIQLCAAAYGVLFTVAALSKLDSWATWSSTTEALFRRRRVAAMVRLGVPSAEIGIGILALVDPVSGLAACGLLVAVFAVTALAKSRGHRGRACNCFGALMPSRIGYSLALRNLVLLLPATSVLALAGEVHPGPLEPAALLAVIVAGALLLVMSEYRRLIARGAPWSREVEKGG